MEIKYLSFGERVKSLRNMFSLKQEEFAKLLGLSQNYISQIETGTRKPSEQLIKGLCYCFYLSEIWLKTGKGEMFIFPENNLKNLMTRFGEQAIVKVFNNILPQESECSMESSEAVYSIADHVNRAYDKDPELKRMIEILCLIYNTGDERTKSWVSVQFDRAFPTDVVEKAEKKQQENQGQASIG